MTFDLRVDGRVAHLRSDCTHGAFLEGLRDDPSLRADWSDSLARLPYEAGLLELPVTTPTTRTRPFEAVVLDAPRLDRFRGDASSFRDHLVGDPVVAFDNLSGSASLIAPDDTGEDWAHLLRFLRSADLATRDALWEAAGHEMALWGPEPVWLSTHGFGVPWLHLRLDRRPKYYAWRPYRVAPL
jgi:hypothetical protein